ncbi:hypothetical protein [Paraburkholderia tropica]|uniref:hypothetical protein n=1 Tax=Paraburkholderia tropica TaxID=92647 RepID=UPI002AB6899A|nr:hypothetical protein [Paraburkholderia tropica]
MKDDDLIFTSDTHVARVVVLETAIGKFRGYVYLRRATDEPEAEAPHQTEADRDRIDLARDDAVRLAHDLLKQYDL